MPRFTNGRVAGRELDRAESVVSQSGISAVTDVTGLAITFTPERAGVWVEAFCPQLQQQTSTGVVTVSITDAANVTQEKIAAVTLPVGFWGPASGKVPLTLTPGTEYTFKVRATTSAGTLVVWGGAGLVNWIRAVEAA
ncbi:MAG: hypothetical protein M3340_02200 [Actinomycetota bacterium]|nr:hypothetical protein [Actinomycetota bacterium]